MFRRPTAVRESEVMGRAAIAVCMTWWLLPAGAYLLGFTGASEAISGLGDRTVTLLWSLLFVAAAALMAVVYAIPKPGDQVRLEVLAVFLFAVAMLVYLAAIYQRAQTLDGRLAILALLGSLLTNLAGYVWLRARQLWVARRAVKTGRLPL